MLGPSTSLEPSGNEPSDKRGEGTFRLLDFQLNVAAGWSVGKCRWSEEGLQCLPLTSYPPTHDHRTVGKEASGLLR